MARKTSLDLALVFSFLIFSLIPFGPICWFLIPVAVCITYNSASKWFRAVPWIFFFLGLYLMRGELGSVTHLDLLSYALLFICGGILVWTRREKRGFVTAVFVPLVLAFVSVLALLIVEFIVSPQVTFETWLSRESRSLILPHFFQREAWLIPKETWSDWALDFYDSILAPILRDGVIGWFAATLGFAYFINGTIETMIRSFKAGQPRKRLKLWAEFNSWKAPEWVLIPLFLGLVMLAYEVTVGQHHMPALRVFGWTLTVASLFPIFCQGICFASFLIPRASFLPFVLIFALLIINPVPVLLLAGLVDLWFDLRSRMNASQIS